MDRATIFSLKLHPLPSGLYFPFLTIVAKLMKEAVSKDYCPNDNLLQVICHALLPKYAKYSLSLIWIMSYHFCFCEVSFGTLSKPSSFIRKCHGLHFGEELWRSMLASCNGLSDHDAQILTINNLSVPNIKYAPQDTRIINKINIAELQLQLSWESWNEVFNKKDVKSMFNSFLNTYLRYFNSSFKIKKKKIPRQQ